MKGIFITGTDTNVGKTYIATLLARQLVKQNIKVIPRKPIESGCKQNGDELIPADALALKNASDYSGSLAQVCPYRFEPPISPLRAAHLSHQTLITSDLAETCLKNINADNDFLLVEGAGGFYSPLCEDGLNADLAQLLDLPVLLVAEDKLGCINQVLLNIHAIESRGLKLLCVILNKSAPLRQNEFMNNKEDLQSLVNYPIFTLATNHNTQTQILDIAHIVINADT